MTKNQLIKKLQKIPGNPVIVCSSDSEGNSFSEPNEISDDLFYWDEENREILDELDIVENNHELQKCIVIWPG